MNLKFLIAVILIFCIHNIKGQTLDEIIDHHKTNLKDLYAQRGAPEKWLTTGEVDEKRLIKVLKQYEKNVAILIYSFNQDSLILSLITTKGLTKTKKSKMRFKNFFAVSFEYINGLCFCITQILCIKNFRSCLTLLHAKQ